MRFLSSAGLFYIFINIVMNYFIIELLLILFIVINFIYRINRYLLDNTYSNVILNGFVGKLLNTIFCNCKGCTATGGCKRKVELFRSTACIDC